MKISGWNDIPEGYGLTVNRAAAPVWLRILLVTPFIDRFAYPVMIRRHIAYLAPHPGWPRERLGAVPHGWLVKDDDAPPGSSGLLVLGREFRSTDGLNRVPWSIRLRLRRARRRHTYGR